MSSLLFEYRCDCGQLLFKGLLFDSTLEIKCRRCKKILGLKENPLAQNPEKSYVILYDHKGDVVGTSASSHKILGYTQDDLLTKNIRDISLFIKDNLQYKKLLHKVKKVGIEPLIVETFHRKKSGEIVSIRARIKLQIVQNKAYAVVFHEIVKRDNAFTYYPEPLSDKIVPCKYVSEMNTDNLFTYVSTGFSDLLQREQIDMIGKSLFEFCPSRESSRLKRDFALMLEHQRSFRIPQLKLQKKDRSFIECDTCFITHYREDNSLRGLIMVSSPFFHTQ